MNTDTSQLALLYEIFAHSEEEMAKPDFGKVVPFDSLDGMMAALDRDEFARPFVSMIVTQIWNNEDEKHYFRIIHDYKNPLQFYRYLLNYNTLIQYLDQNIIGISLEDNYVLSKTSNMETESIDNEGIGVSWKGLFESKKMEGLYFILSVDFFIFTDINYFSKN